MTFEEKQLVHKILKVCGITPEGRDPADLGPDNAADLRRILLYVEHLQQTMQKMLDDSPMWPELVALRGILRKMGRDDLLEEARGSGSGVEE
jgi:hypothetical protein